MSQVVKHQPQREDETSSGLSKVLLRTVRRPQTSGSASSSEQSQLTELVFC